MSTVTEILKAVREVVLMNERITTLAAQVERLERNDAELRERVIRLEAFIDMVRPAVTRRVLSAPADE